MNLSDVDYLRVRMISIRGLTISLALDDYSQLEFNYSTEAELSQAFEAWTKGDRAKLRDSQGQ